MRASVLEILWVAVLLASLAAPAAAAEPTGEVFFQAGGFAGSAALDDARVYGPSVSFARGPDGAWAGSVAGQSVELRRQGDALSGSGFHVVVSTREGRTELEGLVRGRRLHVVLDA